MIRLLFWDLFIQKRSKMDRPKKGQSVFKPTKWKSDKRLQCLF